jgi:hypothetical protein
MGAKTSAKNSDAPDATASIRQSATIGCESGHVAVTYVYEAYSSLAARSNVQSGIGLMASSFLLSQHEYLNS